MSSEVKSILGLPAEILEMIVSHLCHEEKSSREAAVICPTFYWLVCFLRRNKPQRLQISREVCSVECTLSIS